MSKKTEDMVGKKVDDEQSPRFLARLIIVLTAICVGVAVLLAAVNAITVDKIAENTLKSKTEAILGIFKNGTDCELYQTLDDGSEIYLVGNGDGIIGYCAFVKSAGFGGDIEMMVGIDSDYNTEGVKIVAMSETPGVGSKTNSDGFLSRFAGMPHDDPAGKVDVISGASISSRAVKAGVEKAHSIEIDLEAIANEKGTGIVRDTEAPATEPEESTPETTGTDDTAPETAAPETTEKPSADNDPEETDRDYDEIRAGGYVYAVEETVTDPRFVIEITKEEETAETETEKETKKPEPKPETTKQQAKQTEPKPIKPPVTPIPVDPKPVDPEPVDPTPVDPEPIETELDTMPEWLRPHTEETMPEWLRG